MAVLRLLESNPNQAILEVFRELSLPVLRDYDHPKRIQAIKEGLFAREFVKVFTDPKNLAAYCFRWVPPRALAYFNLFLSEPILFKLLCNNIRITAIGAGAGSEVAAIAAFMAACQHNSTHAEQFKKSRRADRATQHELQVNCIDLGEWMSTLSGIAELFTTHAGVHATADARRAKLHSEPTVTSQATPTAGSGDAASIETPVVVDASPAPDAGLPSKPASAPSELGSKLKVSFSCLDVLDAAADAQASLKALYGSSHLIMACFVVNELFLDKKSATEMLRSTIAAMRKGSFLLVVDSASDLSLMEVNGQRYWITVLLDALPGLKRVVARDSHWFRLDDSLKYPTSLENVHCYVRLYQRTE